MATALVAAHSVVRFINVSITFGTRAILFKFVCIHRVSVEWKRDLREGGQSSVAVSGGKGLQD